MWTKQEDEIVRKAVMKYGTNQWNRVSSLLRRHSAADCRQRWRDVLNPRLSNAVWTPQEDANLMELAKQMPNMWRSIGTSLNKSGDAVYNRYLKLSKTVDLPDVRSAGGDASEDELSDTNEDTSELVAANARLSNSMGRKALRKQRERLQSEEKFEQAIREHRETGKRSKTNTVSRPVIDTPGEDQLKSENASFSVRPKGDFPQRERERPRHGLTRPKLILSPPVYETTQFKQTMTPEEVKASLSQLPPPKHDAADIHLKTKPFLL